MISHIFPINKPPRILSAPAPTLSAAAQRAINKERAWIKAHPHRYDGPVLMGLTATAQSVQAYPMTYAASLAEEALDHYPTEFGLGTLGAGLLISDQAGRFLFQLRSEKVHLAGVWALPAAGTVEPGHSFLETIRKEAREELGLAAARLLTNLRPVALCLGPPTIGIYCVFRAELPATAPLDLSHETAEYRWVERGTDFLLGGGSQTLWTEFKARRII